jgi:ubiquinone/menaquinone biosynthesis C-methylase UbiE
MNEKFSYEEYVADEEFLAGYNAYQAKYARQVRESDKILMELVSAAVKARPDGSAPARLLDIGCSTGNLLLHLRRMFPDLRLTGGDLAESSLAECRTNPGLDGIRFERVDILDLPASSRYDIVTVNAVLYMLTDEQFTAALRSIGRVLEPGGTIVVFDFFHPFEQDISIIEASRTHPNGLRLRFRPMAMTARDLEAAGFERPQFRPFTVPIELPRHPDDGELITYTVPTQDGRNLPFRGTLFQPWCHMTAVRTA